MCKSCEGLFPLGVLVLLVVVVAISATPKSIPNYTIETISATCMTEEYDLDIRTVGNSIVITTPVQTPTPCYSLVGNVKFSGNDIDVDLSAVPMQEICIECTGEVTGKVVIQNLTKGTYNLQIVAPGKINTTSITVE